MSLAVHQQTFQHRFPTQRTRTEAQSAHRLTWLDKVAQQDDTQSYCAVSTGHPGLVWHPRLALRHSQSFTKVIVQLGVAVTRVWGPAKHSLRKGAHETQLTESSPYGHRTMPAQAAELRCGPEISATGVRRIPAPLCQPSCALCTCLTSTL